MKFYDKIYLQHNKNTLYNVLNKVPINYIIEIFLNQSSKVCLIAEIIIIY